MTPAKPKKQISVVLPAHNEALQIEKCVREVDRAICSLSDSYEIIVEEDGSTDGTRTIVEDLLSKIPSLIFHHSHSRLGKGKAIKNAVNSADGNIIIFMDVDLATNLECLPELLKTVETSGGMAVGSRHIRGSKVERSASRTLFSLAYNLLVRMLFLDDIHDHQCGFKVMRHELSQTLKNVKSNGFFFDTEMILRCKRSGFPVVEVGVEWSEKRIGNNSKVRLFHDAAKIGLDLFRYKFGLEGVNST